MIKFKKDEIIVKNKIDLYIHFHKGESVTKRIFNSRDLISNTIDNNVIHLNTSYRIDFSMFMIIASPTICSVIESNENFLTRPVKSIFDDFDYINCPIGQYKNIDVYREMFATKDYFIIANKFGNMPIISITEIKTFDNNRELPKNFEYLYNIEETK